MRSVHRSRGPLRIEPTVAVRVRISPSRAAIDRLMAGNSSYFPVRHRAILLTVSYSRWRRHVVGDIPVQPIISVKAAFPVGRTGGHINRFPRRRGHICGRDRAVGLNPPSARVACARSLDLGVTRQRVGTRARRTPPRGGTGRDPIAAAAARVGRQISGSLELSSRLVEQGLKHGTQHPSRVRREDIDRSLTAKASIPTDQPADDSLGLEASFK